MIYEEKPEYEAVIKNYPDSEVETRPDLGTTLDRLEKAVMSLSEEGQKLGDRLKPILVDERPKGTDPNSTSRQVYCPVHEKIDQLGEFICSTTRRLRDIRERLFV